MTTGASPATGHRDLVDPGRARRYRREGWWTDAALADFVARHAADRPAGPAFVMADHTMTWSGYDDAARRLAGVLVAAGVEPGDRVAVWLPDGATVHVAYTAVELAGGTNVGIGARAGDRELRHLLERTRATTLVTFDRHRGRATADTAAGLRHAGVGLRRHVVVPRFEAAPEGPITVNGERAPGPSGAADCFDARRLGPDDLFIINSTSGTTGLPKCVMHIQNRHYYINEMAKLVGGLSGDDVVLGAVPSPFGFGLWTAHFTPTYLGVPTVLLERFDVEEALRLIERERVTVLCCVSTQFIMMLNSPAWEERDLSSLRVMFTGGEPVPYHRARAFEERTGARVLQFYGSNESGLATGTRAGDPPDKRLRTAGRSLPGTELRLFQDGRDVTAGGRGQPGTRGPATCLGYLDDPAANAELFTADGFVLHADVCAIDDDGYLTVVGRTSDIIIRGGKNISAVQVEDDVASHPAVALAAAVPAPDPVFGEKVCVYVELRAGARLALDDLTAFLSAAGTSRESLPEYLVVLEELPRSSGGKLAKGELRADARRRFAAGN